MPDIISILPDSVANQIAAGEVIQRPASAVKELLENAVDAGSTSIKVIVKDAGKTLIQVIDNGCGMSETDARMCLERHATSKITKAGDLFNIQTMGFRGEAIASIAAIAQVELGEELGTKIHVEGSDVKSQEPCTCPDGTSIAVKNLFYNVPARRNFLKSNPVETRHIIDEFHRIAIAQPQIALSLHHDNNEMLHLETGTMRQRIVGIFGTNYNQRLVPVEEKTSILKLTGFVGKPEFAKKTRGEQFFFVNKRFIKNAYLHHAVQNAFKELLSKESYPSYFLFLDMDPKTIDINIHPTKTEIKFENDRAIYAILHSSVKQALGKYNIAPALDFEQETSFNIPPHKTGTEIKAPTIKVNPEYNPFKTETLSPRDKSNKANWEKLYQEPKGEATQHVILTEGDKDTFEVNKNTIFQLQNRYIVTSTQSGLMIIDQQNAHERILYERFTEALEKNKGISQQELFPQTVEFSPGDFQLVKELEKEIRTLGFDIREFGKNNYVIHGAPSDAPEGNTKALLENIIEQYKQNASELKLEKRDNLARSLAKNTAIKAGKILGQEEMSSLIDELLACKMPYYSPNGSPTITMLTLKELEKKFNLKK